MKEQILIMDKIRILNKIELLQTEIIDLNNQIEQLEQMKSVTMSHRED